MSTQWGRTRELTGIVLVVAAEALVVTSVQPLADYYFPVAWFGLILLLDGALKAAGARSVLSAAPRLFPVMIPLSAVIWWVFEGFDLAVDNWHYVGSTFTGFAFVALASISFSTVLLAVWETALCLDVVTGAVPRLDGRRLDPGGAEPRLVLRQPAHHHGGPEAPPPKPYRNPRFIMPAGALAGVLCIMLPVLFPRYAFGLIWGSLFLLLDPVNYWLGRPSLLYDACAGRFSRIIAFAGAALICGFFWESWNYWASVKWVYTVPRVNQAHLFEMPLPGYLGYLPFGLELFAIAVFVLPWLAPLIGSDYLALPLLDGEASPRHERNDDGSRNVDPRPRSA